MYESSDWKQRPAEELALQFLSCKPFSIEVDGTAMVADGRTVQLRERYAEFLKTEVRSIIEEKVRAAIESGNLFYPEMPADGSKLSANFLFSGETYSLRLAYSKRFYDPISKGWMFRPTWEIPWDDGNGGEEDFFEDASKFFGLVPVEIRNRQYCRRVRAATISRGPVKFASWQLLEDC